jgi:hypothetical protein
MNRIRIAMLLFSTVLLATGCGREDSKSVGQDGNFSGKLTTSPNPPSAKSPAQFTLALNDRSGQPVPNATVELHLEMKEMDHGRNVVEMKQGEKPGVYTGTGKFAMDQTWEVYARIQSSHERATLKFQIQVQP